MRTRLQAAEDKIRDLQEFISELQDQGTALQHTVEGHTLFNEVVEARLEKLEDLSKVILSAIDVDVEGLAMAPTGGIESSASIEDDSKDIEVSFLWDSQKGSYLLITTESGNQNSLQACRRGQVLSWCPRNVSICSQRPPRLAIAHGKRQKD